MEQDGTWGIKFRPGKSRKWHPALPALVLEITELFYPQNGELKNSAHWLENGHGKNREQLAKNWDPKLCHS